MGRGGGLNREGGLINFLPLKRGGLLEGGGLFERGGLIEDLRYFNALFIYFSGNPFLCNIDNTKFESYLQSCFEILFVLSKFEIIKLLSIVMNAVNIISEHVNISY